MIALVDCNAFYCSCERLFRPDLQHRPVGVLSNNDGCFVSRTSELKKLGVAMGAPYFKVKDLCKQHNVSVFSANFSLYTNLSDRVMNTLFQFSPNIEIYSVDEAFLDLSGLNENTITEYCRHIKDVVERHTGIPVGIGIGHTKVLAKIANRMAKKHFEFNGVYNALPESHRLQALAMTDIGDVWGIGKQSTLKFKALGIHTAKQFCFYPNEKLIQKQFTKIGRMIQDELKGIPCFPFNELPEKKKEIMCSRTFGNSVYELSSLRESVANYASMAMEKLRKQKSVCQEVGVYVRTNPFKDGPQYAKSHSMELTAPTSDTRKVIKATHQLLDEIFLYGYEYKKAAVFLSRIQDNHEHQIALFGDNDTEKDITLMATMDKINHREGSDTLKLLAQGINKEAWHMKQIMKSPRYLTGWNEILKIQC